jgi:predicted DCC family thiol-disulfide oxidoreductase YuxK
MAPEVVVIYDGGCRACRWGIDRVARIDKAGALGFCPFGHPFAESNLRRLPPDDRHRSMHAVVGKRLYSGTDAARVILRALPFGNVTTAIGLHYGYPLLAKLRGLVGRFAPDVPAVLNCGEQHDDLAHSPDRLDRWG